MSFRWEITFGHVMTFVAGLFTVVGLYVAFALQVGAVDARTLDYPQVRDRVLADDIRLNALTAAITAQTASNEAVRLSLAGVREDLAAIKATLAARGAL